MTHNDNITVDGPINKGCHFYHFRYKGNGVDAPSLKAIGGEIFYKVQEGPANKINLPNKDGKIERNRTFPVRIPNPDPSQEKLYSFFIVGSGPGTWYEIIPGNARKLVSPNDGNWTDPSGRSISLPTEDFTKKLSFTIDGRPLDFSDQRCRHHIFAHGRLGY